MTVMCQDPMMIEAYQHDKDLYASIASLAFNRPYEDCLEHYLDENGKQTDKVNPEGKAVRSQSKSILLGILYGRGINSVAEQLNTTPEKAQQIQDRIFKGFPAIKQFEDDTIEFAKEYGFVTTYWGRKRRLPEMQLNEYEFTYDNSDNEFDVLSFTDKTVRVVPDDVKRKYIRMLKQAYGKRKAQVKTQALQKDGIIITDNGGKIADATRQCVNSRIQGSASDLTKLAAIEIYNNQRLKELGFKLLIPVHDEFIAECPVENAKECAELFSKCMSDAARDMCIPIKTDVEAFYNWYGEKVDLDSL